jgi:ABC-type Zn uptake system ZnuABC Zn-binding protein ZnuA
MMRPVNRGAYTLRVVTLITCNIIAAVGLANDENQPEPIAVVATLPILGELAREVGGELVNVSVLAHPDQDPHFVQPRPTLMKKTRYADVFIELGLGLEIWAQKVVDGAGNPDIQTGQPGRVVASRGIPTVGRPAVLSRAGGDVHPEGNPHLWLDPLNTQRMAANVAAGLKRVRPEAAADFEAGLARFSEDIATHLFGTKLVEEVGANKLSRLAESESLYAYLDQHGLSDKLGGWLSKARRLRGAKVVTYHRTWPYFAHRFGLKIVAEIEEKPGISPSAKHRDWVVSTAKSEKIQAVLLANFYERRAADYIGEQTGTPVIELAIEPSAESGGGSYTRFMDYLIDMLLDASKEAAP